MQCYRGSDQALAAIHHYPTVGGKTFAYQSGWVAAQKRTRHTMCSLVDHDTTRVWNFPIGLAQPISRTKAGLPCLKEVHVHSGLHSGSTNVHSHILDLGQILRNIHGMTEKEGGISSTRPTSRASETGWNQNERRTRR